MDKIPYPRSLNRPTYLVWRFTFKDIRLLFLTFGAAMLPSVFDNWPIGTACAVWGLFVLYRGAVVTLKPRGWERHVFQSWFAPVAAVAGHCFHRCFIREAVAPAKKRFWHKFLPST